MGERSEPIRQVAIIGAGSSGPVSGAALAMLCTRAGFRTVLEDVLPSNLRRAAERLGVENSELRYAGSIEEAVREADLVLDTVPDELESKLEILSLLDRMAPPRALFATPTETLSIADLASCTYRPGQCFGLSFRSLQPLQIALGYTPACNLETLRQMQAFLFALAAKVESSQDTCALP